MQAARVIGRAHATVKHSSLNGWKLLALQPVDINNEPDDFPVIAIDRQGAGTGDMVFFTSDGNAIRDIVGRNDCPIRFAVLGILDA